MINHSKDSNVRLVNYTELPDHLFDIISDLRLEYTSIELDAISERSKRHSKHPIGEIVHRQCGEEKFDRLEELASTVRAAYERLEVMKTRKRKLVKDTVHPY